MTDRFVIDTNVVIEWLLREPRTPVGDAARARFAEAMLVAPMQLWSEAHTSILKRARSGALSAAGRDKAIETLAAFGVEYVVTTQTDLPRVLGKAIEHGLTVYDAFFLDVAVERRLPLATNDQPLRRAAHEEGVALV